MNQESVSYQCKMLSDGLAHVRKEYARRIEAIEGHLTYLQNLCRHPHHKPAEDEGKTTIKLTYCPNCGKDY